jgi:hypothetical protein
MEHNCFGGPSTTSVDDIHSKMADRSTGSVGVWLVASYFNHACDANAFRSYFGDCMIVRATNDIAKDQEILRAYRSPNRDYIRTQEVLEKVWKFQCECGICTAEARTSPAHRKERQGLIEETKIFLENHREPTHYSSDGATIARAEKLYAKLDATYDKKIFTNVPRIPLVELGRWLCVAYFEHNIHKVIKTAESALNDSGYQVEVHTATQSLRIDRTNCYLDVLEIDVAIYAALAYIYYGNIVIGKQYETFAKERDRTINGELRGFEDRYGN